MIRMVSVCALLMAAMLPAPRVDAAGPEPVLNFDVVGVSQPVDILIDPWGVPHVFAGTVNDAFFAQGFMTARDRLWQIDLARRRALGRLAAVLGPAFVPFDHAARLFLDRRDPVVLLNALGPQVSEIARSYVAGINAYIGLTVAQPQLLPPEFALLGYLPEPWAVDELVRRQQFGAGSIASKIRRAEMACRGLLDIDALRAPLEPAWTTSVPPGLDPCGITPADLSVLLSGPLPFRPGLVQTAPLKAGALGIAPDGARDGSNAWAVAPHFSATGRPILANDPHLPIGIPSIRYIIHLEAPGFAVAGGSVPGWPGIANGHNSRIGFGRTDFSLDRDDLYVLETKPDDPDSYRRSEGWQRFETIEEEIPVKGAAPARVELKFSSLGPVVSVQPDRHRALAVRASRGNTRP
jgi:penicillin G amidase